MVEVLDAQVDWKEGYGNAPELQVRLDEIPPLEDARFQAQIFENGRGLYYADQDGFVRYYTWSGDGNDGGYSGRGYNITLTNGIELTLKGPFSSRAGVMNKYDFGPCVDIQVTTDESVMEKGYTFSSGALSLELAKEAAEQANVWLAQTQRGRDDEPVWTVAPNHPTEWQAWSNGASDVLKRFKLEEDESVEIVVREQDDSVYPRGVLYVDGEEVEAKSPNMTSPMCAAIRLMKQWNDGEVNKGAKPEN